MSTEHNKREDLDAAQDVEATGEEISPTSPHPFPQRPELPTWRKICIIISVCFGLFLSLLDTTIVATALYTIGVDLESLDSVNWVALAYTLAYLGCAVIFARISDVAGRRNAYIAAFLIFFAFSIGCGFSQSLNQLITCRALQGVGGSGLYSLTFVILPEVTSEKGQRWIAALAGGVITMSGVLGPVLGGVITNYTTWRWVFWINAPIGIIPLVIFIISWPKPHQLRPTIRRSPKELDLLGCILIIAASVLVVFSFQEAGTKANAWTSAIFIAPLSVGCLSWILLFAWEFLVDKRWEGKIATMFPMKLIRRRVYMGYVLSTLLAGFPYFLVIYALPTRLQVVNEKSALMAGIGLLPMLGSVAVGSTLGGAFNARKNHTFQTLLAGSILLVIGTAALSTLKTQEKVQGGVYGFQVFVGLGFGLTVSTVSLGATLESEIRDTTVAQGIIAQMRVFGGSIGISASTAILGSTQRRDLTGIITPSQVSTLEHPPTPLSLEQVQAVRKAYSDAFSQEMKVCAVISGACVLASLLAWQRNPMEVREKRMLLIEEEQERLRGLIEAKLAREAESSG